MTNESTPTRSVVMEKEYPHPPEKVWRALTESSLIEQWLMQNDFEPVPGRSFNLRREPVAGWNGVIDCMVIDVEPGKALSYTWGTLGLGTVVTWTLTPTSGGTHVRMEQSGFSMEQENNFKGAKYGWQHFLGALERVLGEL